MNNLLNNNLKTANNKNLIMSIIILVSTFVLGLIFILNIDNDFIITKTIFGKITSLDGSNPGEGEFLLISLFLGSLAFLGELTLLLIMIFIYFIIPVGSNFLSLLINIIARLFQIGEYKNWKNTTTKVLLYISLVLQGILINYLLFLCFSGFNLIYILIYLMLFINIFGFVKGIINLNDIKVLQQNN